MADLKPCPFCGGNVRFDKAYSYFRDSIIYCDDCDMVFTLDDCQSSDDEICEAWNRRAEPVRHGRWIPIEYDSYADGAPVWDKYECSECGHEHVGEEDTLTDYCPKCGARMYGGADNG